MKKFNKDKYLKQLKIKRFYRKYERYFYIGIPCLLVGILGIYFAYSKFTTTDSVEVIRTTVGDFISGDVVINNYVNGELVVDAPAMNTGYKVDKIVCDNGAVGEWSTKDWGPTITNVTKRNKCNIYFIDNEKIKFGNTEIPLDYYGRCPEMNTDGTVTVTEAESSYGYLCKAKDAYGDSYYFRGNVTNNYVKFGKWSKDTPDVVKGFYSATSTSYKEYSTVKECQSASSYNVNCTVISKANKDMYWRIIRINGNNTIRVIYDGTSAHANGESSSDRQIGTSVFNDGYRRDEHVYLSSYYNAHVGYMYGKIPASTYATTHANTNNSTIKTYLDTWYENNIKGTSNEQYVKDNLFCNDRSLASTNTGTGAGTSSTSYNWAIWHPSKINLKCPQQNDAFTVSDTTNGNGALTYGVGLVTTDEIVLAGGWSSANSNYYLYSGQNYWTMSPLGFYDYYARECNVSSGGNAAVTNDRGPVTGGGRDSVMNRYGTRPVLNLSSEILKNGNGTVSDPYHLAS